MTGWGFREITFLNDGSLIDFLEELVIGYWLVVYGYVAVVDG